MMMMGAILNGVVYMMTTAIIMTGMFIYDFHGYSDEKEDQSVLFVVILVISIKMTIAECPGRGHNSLGNQSGESRDVRLDRYITNIIIIMIIIILITIMFKVGLYVYFYIAVVACLSVFWVLTQNF